MLLLKSSVILTTKRPHDITHFQSSVVIFSSITCSVSQFIPFGHDPADFPGVVYYATSLVFPFLMMLCLVAHGRLRGLTESLIGPYNLSTLQYATVSVICSSRVKQSRVSRGFFFFFFDLIVQLSSTQTTDTNVRLERSELGTGNTLYG